MTEGTDQNSSESSLPSSAGASDDPSNVSTRAAARDTARVLREQHRRRERARRWGWGVAVAALVVGAGVVVAGVLLLLPGRAPVGPLNMPGDAVRIGQDGTLRGPGVAGGGVVPAPSASAEAGALDIRLYVDFFSEDSGEFIRDEGESLAAWAESGTATVEIHPVAMLTTQSAGTQYSLRAANALGCVVNFAPDSALDYVLALFEDQPEQGSEGLSDDELIAHADDVVSFVPIESSLAPEPGASDDPAVGEAIEQPSTSYANVMPRIERCIIGQDFRPWVIAATERAVKGPLPGTEVPAVAGTPTILVQGRPFEFDPLIDANEFRKFVLQVVAEEFATPTPSPTPSTTS